MHGQETQNHPEFDVAGQIVALIVSRAIDSATLDMLKTVNEKRDEYQQITAELSGLASVLMDLAGACDHIAEEGWWLQSQCDTPEQLSASVYKIRSFILGCGFREGWLSP